MHVSVYDNTGTEPLTHLTHTSLISCIVSLVVYNEEEYLLDHALKLTA